MTGFGRGEYSDGKRNVTAEIKTVNHRYSDITVKMPKRYSFAEEPIKAVIREKLRRGKAEVSIVIENITEEDVQGFFAQIGNWFSNVWTQITDWFSGLFK